MSDPFSAVVVGAGGFIGGRLAASLAAAGVPVCAVTRSDPLPSARQLRTTGTVFLVAGSVTPLSAQTRPASCAADLDLVRRVLDRAVGGGGRPHVVLAGSGGTCYDTRVPPPYRESDPVRSTTAYAELKLAQERLVAGSGLPVTVLRLANVYGCGQRTGTGQGVVAHWLDAATRGEPMHVFGDLGTIRDYLYLDDLMDLFLRVHRHRRPVAPVLNVGSGVPTPLRRVLGLVAAATGQETPQLNPLQARPVDRQRVWLDVGLARTALGWRPRTSLAEGIRLTCAALTRS